MIERPRARELLLAYQRADAERPAFGAKAPHLRTPEAVHEASVKAAAAHREWQAELSNAEAGQ